MGTIYQVGVGAFVGIAAAIGVLGGISQSSWVSSVPDALIGGVALGVTAYSILREIPGR